MPAMKYCCGVKCKIVMIAVLASSGMMTWGTGCTEEETAAVLAGVQVVAEELDESDDVSFRDWLSSELED
jgi:hypothetical protein